MKFTKTALISPLKLEMNRQDILVPVKATYQFQFLLVTIEEAVKTT